MEKTASTPVVTKKKHHHHHYHHHHRNPYKNDNYGNYCFGLFFFVFILIFVVWIILWYTIPVSTSAKAGELTEAFVFKKRYANMKPSRKRHECKTSETFSVDLEMCVPIIKQTPYDDKLVDSSVSPCTSMFNHSCGIWNSQHVNEDRAFTFAYWKNQKTLNKLIKTTDSLNRFYTSCMKMHSIESQKEAELEYIHMREIILGKFRGYSDLPTVFGKLQRMGFTSPLLFSIQKHPISARNIPWLSWNGFDDLKHNHTVAILNVLERTRLINKFTTREVMSKMERIAKVLKLLEEHDTDPLSDIVDYESYIRDGGVNQDIVKFGDLPQWYGNSEFGWTQYFDAIDGMGLQFKKSQDFWVISRPYLKWLVETGINTLEIQDWKSYIEFSLLININSFMPNLPSNVYFREWDVKGPLAFEETGPNTRFDFHHLRPDASSMYGTTIEPKKEEECVELTTHMLPGIVAKAFLERAFGNKEMRDCVRDEVREMTRNILDTFVGFVQTNTWITSKAVLIEKLNNVVIRVAEPDEWTVEPFESRIFADRYEHNMNLVRKYRVYRDIQLWHKDKPDYLDRNAIAFFATPLSSVNAYYSGPTNTITILAGILQEPFWQQGSSKLVKYAILGSIIGHELGHVLDYNGLHWDKDGVLKLNSIVDEKTLTEFNKITEKIVVEYNKTPGECVGNNNAYGVFTLNENIADLLGVKLSYHAYFDKHTASLNDKQTFFMAFGQTWCSTYDIEKKCKKIKTDVHSLPEYRIDRTLRNLPEFRAAFNCKVGDPMRNENEIKIY
jgi:predicted metalloendopeptidase